MNRNISWNFKTPRGVRPNCNSTKYMGKTRGLSCKDFGFLPPTAQSETFSRTSISFRHHYRPSDRVNKSACGTLTKTALSAIKRATSQTCKNDLQNIACQMKSNKLVPQRLPNYCLRNGSIPGTFIGCYHDSNQSRLLSSYGVRQPGLTVQKCVDLCTQSSYAYAGVHHGKECYCGTQKPPTENLLTRSYCSVPCDGLSSQTCGGIDATEVFDTAVPAKHAKMLRLPEKNSSKVPIAFVLTLNGRGLRQVTRLLKLIYRTHHTYLLHVDARQDYLYRHLLNLENKFSNIKITKNRHASIWGGASLLDVILSAITELLQIDNKWEWVFNLSESDFPIYPIEDLEALLAANQGRNFLRSHGRKTFQFIHKQGLDRVFHECDNHMWRVGDRTLPAGIRIDGGSDWIGLTRQLAEYATGLAEPNDPLVLGLRNLFHYTLLPAESFFHILVLNSRFCDTYTETNLRVTLWRRDQGCLCQHHHVVDWCGCSPMVYRTADWHHLNVVMSKSSVFFARKFESAIDQTIINRLEEKITNTSITLPGWNSYWENTYYHKDLKTAQNSALVAVATSLASHSLALLNQNSEAKCSHLNPGTVISVTSYFRLDHYQGDLILFEDDITDGQFEVLVKPLSKTTFLVNNPRIVQALQVGSDYDPKEQILRNRLGVLSPSAKPIAVFKWNDHFNVTSNFAHLVWFDAKGRLRAVHQINVTDTAKFGYHALDIKDLTVGTWTVVAVQDRRALAASEFFVTPLVDDQLNDSDIKEHQFQKTWESFLPTQSKNRQELLYLKEGRISYINRMTPNFYAIQDICYVKVPKACAPAPPSDWQSCTTSDWSSLSPDPKSAFL
nr:EOG090X01AN [Macrothrix elegans]